LLLLFFISFYTAQLYFTQHNYWCLLKLVELEPGKSKIKNVYVIYAKVIFYDIASNHLLKL